MVSDRMLSCCGGSVFLAPAAVVLSLQCENILLRSGEIGPGVDGWTALSRCYALLREQRCSACQPCTNLNRQPYKPKIL